MNPYLLVKSKFQVKTFFLNFKFLSSFQTGVVVPRSSLLSAHLLLRWGPSVHPEKKPRRLGGERDLLLSLTRPNLRRSLCKSARHPFVSLPPPSCVYFFSSVAKKWCRLVFNGTILLSRIFVMLWSVAPLTLKLAKFWTQIVKFSPNYSSFWLKWLSFVEQD